jgi:hypothetical protein
MMQGTVRRLIAKAHVAPIFVRRQQGNFLLDGLANEALIGVLIYVIKKHRRLLLPSVQQPRTKKLSK